MSKVAEYNRIKKEMAEMEARLAQIKGAATAELELIELVKSTAAEKGLSLLDIALALAPQLEKASGKASKVGKDVKGEGRTPRRARVLKRYTNPHTNEAIETKGGNHRQLKEWKEQWGAEVVEGWMTKAE
jgi:hypothetical protein